MEYFSRTQLIHLADRLSRLTEEGKITWQEFGNAYAFESLLKSHSFVIESRDRDDLAPHVFSVVRHSDPPRVLQSLDTTFEDAELASAMARLYDAVKRVTLQLDNVANEIFEALEELEGPSDEGRLRH